MMGSKKIKQVKQKQSRINSSFEKVTLRMDYPVFCFKYLDDRMFRRLTDGQRSDFVSRLSKISQLSWNEINTKGRHEYGTELMPLRQIKPALPNFVTDDVENLTVFRYTSKKHPFLGIRMGNVFHILFVERHFGEVYDH